ncbi:hypothetical protein Goarm_014425 [Gossypium armourianum]|uniref:Retrotransposon gag domain-containing protein n=1 Tax=Gossypium armourianum TaxID=34283 RepID=A0A7J9J757_9ROSI|nr:hypothetical protein [Gossypium armourianum]
MIEALDPNVEVMQWVLNSTMDKLTVKDDALEVMVLTLKEHIEELKEELVICKADLGKRMLDSVPKQHKMDVSKPKGFKGTRFARNVNNFLWGMKHYFRVIDIENDAIKNEFRKQFYPKYVEEEAWAKLCQIMQQGTVREFTKLLLKILNLSEKEAFYWFKDGLNPRRSKSCVN